jgi:hypothetical protein
MLTLQEKLYIVPELEKTTTKKHTEAGFYFNNKSYAKEALLPEEACSRLCSVNSNSRKLSADFH